MSVESVKRMFRGKKIVQTLKEPEQPDPTSSRDDLNNILTEHDQKKKRVTATTRENRKC